MSGLPMETRHHQLPLFQARRSALQQCNPNSQARTASWPSPIALGARNLVPPLTGLAYPAITSTQSFPNSDARARKPNWFRLLNVLRFFVGLEVGDLVPRWIGGNEIGKEPVQVGRAGKQVNCVVVVDGLNRQEIAAVVAHGGAAAVGKVCDALGVAPLRRGGPFGQDCARAAGSASKSVAPAMSRSSSPFPTS